MVLPDLLYSADGPPRGLKGGKFRPIKPRSPHLNGKVERSQQTDLQEFYRTVDLNDPDLNNKLAEWQFYYNCAGSPVLPSTQ